MCQISVKINIVTYVTWQQELQPCMECLYHPLDGLINRLTSAMESVGSSTQPPHCCRSSLSHTDGNVVFDMLYPLHFQVLKVGVSMPTSTNRAQRAISGIVTMLGNKMDPF